MRLLRLHLVEGQPISTICDKHRIHPTLFYQWQKTLFENGAAAFDRPARPRGMDSGAAKVEQLEARLRRKDEVIAAVTGSWCAQKKSLGRTEGKWTPSDERDAVVDFLKHMNTLTEIPFGRLLPWLELCQRKFARWRERYGRANGHNAQAPRDHWLEPREKQAIISYAI